MPDASITLLQFMELGELLKSSRGSMPEFNQVADLSGSDKVLFFYMLNYHYFSDQWQKKVVFLRGLITKISGNQTKRMLKALQGSLTWEELNSAANNMKASKMRHSLMKKYQSGALRTKIKVRPIIN